MAAHSPRTRSSSRVPWPFGRSLNLAFADGRNGAEVEGTTMAVEAEVDALSMDDEDEAGKARALMASSNVDLVADSAGVAGLVRTSLVDAAAA